jgi:hypothetical protein
MSEDSLEYKITPRELRKRELEDRYILLVNELTSWAEPVKIIELSTDINRNAISEIKRKELQFRGSMREFMLVVDELRKEAEGRVGIRRKPKV